jgi:hypothetical protein
MFMLKVEAWLKIEGDCGLGKLVGCDVFYLKCLGSLTLIHVVQYVLSTYVISKIYGIGYSGHRLLPPRVQVVQYLLNDSKIPKVQVRLHTSLRLTRFVDISVRKRLFEI